MSSKSGKRRKKKQPFFARELARFHTQLQNGPTRETQLTASKDDTRLDFANSSSEHAASADESSSSSQAITLKIPDSPKKGASTRFNIRALMKKNAVTDTAIADNANEEDSEELDDAALEKLGQKEEEGGLLDANDAVEEGDDDDEHIALPSEARVEEILELFGPALQAQIGDNYKERIAEMYENNEASKLYSLLKEVVGDELLRGIDTAARPTYELNDPMEIDADKEDDDEDGDSIEEETKKKLRKAEQKLRGNAEDVEMQDAFEKVVHDALDRKSERLEDRESADRAYIFDIMNNSLGEGIEDVVAKLTITNLKSHISKNYKYFSNNLFSNAEDMAVFQKIYHHTVLLAALHLRTFTKPETRSTLNLAWSLFYGSVNGTQNRRKDVGVPPVQELGFEPKGDQLSVAAAVCKDIEVLESSMQAFTGKMNAQIDTAPATMPGAEFFRALKSSDYNVSVCSVPSLECAEGTRLRCAISGEPLHPGDSVFAFRFLSLRMADQTLIPPTFRGSGSWQNQNYRDVFRIFYIKQRIKEYPPRMIRDAPATPTPTQKASDANTQDVIYSARGLSCWKADTHGGGFYLRYSALLEKILSFREKVYRKDPATLIATISGLTADKESFFREVSSITTDDLRTPEAVAKKLKAVALAIGNKNANMARDVLAACFCQMDKGHAFLVSEKPAYMAEVGLGECAVDCIEAIVAVSNKKSMFISIFCAPNQSSEEYEKLLAVGKALLGAKTALPALLAVVKIIDTMVCVSPRG